LARSAGDSTLPTASVGVDAELHDSTDSGVLVFVAEDLLDGRERVLAAAVAGRHPLNPVGMVQSRNDLVDDRILRRDKVESARDEARR
jgi:hypothetical protein